jgi:hypothetical protein
MQPRKTRDLKSALEKKGFTASSNKDKKHHDYYFLYVDGKKSHIYTYFSHGQSEYNSFLMAQIKKQLKFPTANDAEDFFDCPLTKEKYIEKLIDSGVLQREEKPAPIHAEKSPKKKSKPFKK